MWLRGFMFTRYATFIFLIGLSALFFTSGRSASRHQGDEQGRRHVVTAAEDGASPDAARTDADIVPDLIRKRPPLRPRASAGLNQMIGAPEG